MHGPGLTIRIAWQISGCEQQSKQSSQCKRQFKENWKLTKRSCSRSSTQRPGVTDPPTRVCVCVVGMRRVVLPARGNEQPVGGSLRQGLLVCVCVWSTGAARMCRAGGDTAKSIQGGGSCHGGVQATSVADEGFGRDVWTRGCVTHLALIPSPEQPAAQHYGQRASSLNTQRVPLYCTATILP